MKDVNVDVTYRGDLLGQGTRGKDGAFVDGEKRPGKIFTSMSFGDGDEQHYYAATANSTINWGRQLLSQVKGFVFLRFVCLLGNWKKTKRIGIWLKACFFNRVLVMAEQFLGNGGLMFYCYPKGTFFFGTNFPVQVS